MSKFDQESKAIAQAHEKKLSVLSSREHSSSDNRTDDRCPFGRDYARVLYSASFRRLQGKMQLLGVNHTNFHRNRLTHSLEVAQLARSLASELGLLNPVVSETASLLHDIGNPPFGHAGEKILNDLCKNDDGHEGYEGNAQALRIVRQLEKRSYKYSGLNLTHRTMFAITKYFYNREDNPNKFLYNKDYDFLARVAESNNLKTGEKTIDAHIMDICDEIAYAAHDLEDAISKRLITIGEILHEFQIDEDYRSARDCLLEIDKNTREFSEKSWGYNLLNSSEEYSTLFKKELTSKIVHTLYSDIRCTEENGRLVLDYGTDEKKKLAKGLKRLVFRALLRKNHIQEYELRGEKVIKGLFEVYMDDGFNKKLMLLPPELRALTSNFSDKRLVVDYIAGMMDAFAAQEYIKYFGESEYNKLYR